MTYAHIKPNVLNRMGEIRLKHLLMDNIKIQEDNTVEETQHQIMTLVDEQSSTVGKPTLSTGNEASSTADEHKEHGLTDFLKREIKVSQGNILASQVRGTVLFRISIPQDLLQNEMYAMKTDGFRYLKGTVELKIVFNAQPFQAGIFRVMYFPVLSPDGNYNTSLSTMKQMTGLNGVDVNLETKEPMIIQVPFVYPLPSYDMVLEPDPWATVQLVVYSPLSAGSVSYTVFGRFSDVALSMPTSESLPNVVRVVTNKVGRFRQQIGYDQKIARKARWNIILSSLILFSSIMSTILYIVQKLINRPSRFKQQIGAEEMKSKPGTPIASIASAVSNVATTLSGIPTLSSIAKPIAGISSLVAGVASMFGWSKPRSTVVVTQTRPKICEGFNNYNAAETSHSMALDNLNATIVTDGKFGTNLDEMSFAALWRVPQFIGAFPMRTSDLVDARLYMAKLNPITLTTTVTNSIVTTTNLGYICANFELFRGSLVFNLKCAKTIFHSTRVAIVFFNTEEEPPLTYTPDLVKNYQIIWDIRQTYEQTFSIPYIQAIEWLNLHSNDTDFKNHMGYIAVYVVNDLVVGGTASNSIEFLVEVFAGEDFSVAIPKNFELLNGYVRPITSNVASHEGNIIFTREPANVRYLAPWQSGTGTLMALGVVYSITDFPTDTMFVASDGLVPLTTLMVSYTATADNAIWMMVINGTENTLVTAYYGTFNMPGTFLFILPSSYVRTITKDEKIALTEQIVDDTTMPAYGSAVGSEETIDLENVTLVYKDLGTVGSMKTEPLIVFQKKFRKVRISTMPELARDGYIVYKFKGDVDFAVPGFQKAKVKEVAVAFLSDRVVDHYTLKIYTNTKEVSKRLLLYSGLFKFDDQRKKFVSVYRQQIGKEEALLKANFDKITGSLDLVPFSHEHTVGENIVSFRQLGRRYTLFKEVDSVVTTALGGGTFVLFDPKSFEGNSKDIVDYLSFIAPLYRFYNGEVRYKFTVRTAENHLYSGPLSVYLLPNYVGETPPGINAINSSQILHFPHIEGMGEFTAPYYNRNNKTILGDTRSIGLLAPIPLRVMVFVPNSTPLKMTFYRTMGENFSFGTALSAPTLIWMARS